MQFNRYPNMRVLPLGGYTLGTGPQVTCPQGAESVEDCVADQLSGCSGSCRGISVSKAVPTAASPWSR